MNKEIRKETDGFGNEKEVIYEGGEKVGEIHEETDAYGTPIRREYDTSGTLVTETQYDKTYSGEDIQRTYGPDGKLIYETQHEETYTGEKVDRTYANGELIRETQRDSTYYGTPFKRVREFPPSNRGTTSSGYRTSMGTSPSSSYGFGSATKSSSSFFSAVNPKVWAILILLIWVAVSWGGIFLANRMIEGNSSIFVWLLATVIWLICLPGALAGLLIPLLVVLLLIAL